MTGPVSSTVLSVCKVPGTHSHSTITHTSRVAAGGIIAGPTEPAMLTCHSPLPDRHSGSGSTAIHLTVGVTAQVDGTYVGWKFLKNPIQTFVTTQPGLPPGFLYSQHVPRHRNAGVHGEHKLPMFRDTPVPKPKDVDAHRVRTADCPLHPVIMRTQCATTTR